ncbi:hypothetical protein ACFY7Z_11515 [Streptomyces sp. NPDC012623]|uniref:hypothetical protein n=1 Tax=unclassified Streptomyces TaxID=2593676 RepID=UPI0036827FB2
MGEDKAVRITTVRTTPAWTVRLHRASASSSAAPNSQLVRVDSRRPAPRPRRCSRAPVKAAKAPSTGPVSATEAFAAVRVLGQ